MPDPWNDPARWTAMLDDIEQNDPAAASLIRDTLTLCWAIMEDDTLTDDERETRFHAALAAARQSISDHYDDDEDDDDTRRH